MEAGEQCGQSPLPMVAEGGGAGDGRKEENEKPVVPTKSATALNLGLLEP